MESQRTSSSENPQFAMQNELARSFVAALELGVEHQKHAKEMEQRAAEMEAAALTDPLTGLGNSRALEIRFNELTRSNSMNRQDDPKDERVFKPHSLVALDVDHFSDFNNENGHKYGDKALREFASRFRKEAFRRSEASDEFFILLPFTTEKEAVEIAKKILERENAAGLEASVGVTEINAMETLEYNMHCADEAMYAAKENGRNQVFPRSVLDNLDQQITS